MVSYTNETKVKDIPTPSFESEIRELLKSAIFDFGSEMKKDQFEHTVTRLSYLISSKYKGFMIGEVKYVFEGMVDQLKGKLSVSTIMQLFWKYQEGKIERQRLEMDDKDMEYDKSSVNCLNTPFGKAIIHKMELRESGQLPDDKWDKLSLKQVAEDIQSGKIRFNYKPDKKIKHTWDL